MGEPNVVIRILVVDDDATCLSLVSGYLQRKNHHVIATKNPLDALSTLRMKWQSFDLILTDVHMPEMSGLDLLNYSVEEQFKIPVILMSSDADVAIMRQGLKDGAAHYFVKPMALDILERIWQFALPQNPNNRGPMPSFDHNYYNKNTTIIINNNNNMVGNNVLAVPQNHMLNNNEGNNNNNVNNHIEVGNAAPNQGRRKPKLVWTTSLHNLFLEAVNKIGVDRAVPKKILEYMNVPGLRRENIASHLQKYRIFLKRIATQQANGNNWNERPLRSSFVLNEITFLTHNLQQQYQQLLRKSHKKGQCRSQAASPSGDEPNKEVGTSRPSGGMQVIQETSEITTKNDRSSPMNTMHNHEANFTSSVNNEKNLRDNEIPPTINEGTENPRCAPSNYVGLRLNSNGELFGTVKDMPFKSTMDIDIMASNTKITNGTNQGAIAGQEVNMNSAHSSPNNLFGADENQVVNNATHQVVDIGVSQEGEVLSSQQVDQGVFHNDDFSMEYNYMQEDGQNFGDFIQEGGFDFTCLD